MEINIDSLWKGRLNPRGLTGSSWTEQKETFGFRRVDKSGIQGSILHVSLELASQPFDDPRSKARGLLRVDTERRFLPHPEGRGLAPSKYQFLQIQRE
jgi:hypothetical protein